MDRAGIEPREMPFVRREHVDWLSTTGQQMYLAYIRAGVQRVRPEGCTDVRAAQVLADGESLRLRAADLFHVSDDMTDLVMGAARSLPEFHLQPEDLPSPHGLLVFARPVFVVRRGADSIPIQAVAWGPFADMFPDTGGIWLTAYGLRDGVVYSDPEWVSGGARARLSPLIPEQDFPIGFGEASIIVEDDDGRQRTWRESLADPEQTSVYLFAVLRTVWLLMQQPLARVQDLTCDRADRRRFARNGGQEPPAVRVITLRRVSAASSGGVTSREYHHQWLVKGHWREQWLPSRKVHRPTWIAPHVKGPEGKPFLAGGEKVYAFRR